MRSQKDSLDTKSLEEIPRSSTIAMAAAILHKFVDADQWEAEGILGRLGMLVHAAFLFAGFQTYGARPPSGHLLLKRSGDAAGSLCLSRRYTAPQLARREGADAAALVVCAQGSGEIALVMFLTAGGADYWERSVYLERLHAGTVAPLLSRSLGDTEPWGSRVCRALADGPCWGLLRGLCRRNGLALTSLVPLPDDVVVEILRRLSDAEDLARVESAGRDLRRVVAERDGELWKPRYENLSVRRRRPRRSSWLPVFLFGWDSSEESESEEVEVRHSWKEKFVKARPPRWDRIFSRMYEREHFWIPNLLRIPSLSSSPQDWLQDVLEQDTDSTKGEGTGGHRRNVPRTRNNYNKKWRGNGTGAIHSPSSRYRWKHR